MAEQPRRDVAVFIDFENIYVSVRDKLDANPNFEIIMDHCNELGRVILSRAYADWYRYPRITSALYANNIEPMYVPTYYYDKGAGRTGGPIKNSVDMNLCIDAMRTLFTMPGLSTFVLITGDRDFIPLVNSIRQQGKDVIIIGVGGAASSHLAQSADEFIFYEQMVGKAEATAPKAEPRRALDVDDFERPIRERERISVPRSKPERKESTVLNEDESFDLLVKVVLEARARRMVTGIGSLKTLMRELSNGEFRESTIRDGNGRPIEKFKDFITEAARRGKIIISTEGVVNEVFLPGEDPKALSQFSHGDSATERKDDDVAPVAGLAPERLSGNATSTADKSRRRRRRGDRTPDRTPDVRTNGKSEAIPHKGTSADEQDLSIPAQPTLAPVPAGRAEPTAVREVADEDTNGESTLLATPFSDEERRSVREIVAASERPLSFQQIYDTLRSSRNRGGENTIMRTNEDLRSLVKLSINAGELQRIGRGNRVSYRIAPVAVDEQTSAAAVDSAAAAATREAATPVVRPQMIPTPQELSDDGLALPTAVATPPQRRRTKQTESTPVTPVTAPTSELTPPTEQKRRGPKPKGATAPSAAPTVVTLEAPATPVSPAARDNQREARQPAPERRTPAPRTQVQRTPADRSPEKASAPKTQSDQRTQPARNSNQRNSAPRTTNPRTASAPKPSGNTTNTPATTVSPVPSAKPRRRKQNPEA